MCFHDGPLVFPCFSLVNAIFQPFLISFSIGLRRISLRAKARHLVFICSLLVGTDCVTDKYY